MRYTAAVLRKPADGKWYIYYSYRHPVSGYFVPFKERGGMNRIKDKKQRAQYAAIMVSEINNMLQGGWSPFLEDEPKIRSEYEDLSLLACIDLLNEVKRGSVRKRSYDHYVFAKNLLKRFLEKKEAILIKPKYFTSSTAQQYSDYLVTDLLYKPKSHNNQIANMNVVFNELVERGVITANPFAKIKKKKEDEGRILYYDYDQRATLSEYFLSNDHPMYLFTQWEFYCFIRPAELMGIKVRHIDFANKTVMVPAEVAKNRKNGVIPIKDEFFEIVKNRYFGLPPDYYLFSESLQPGPVPKHRNIASESHKLALRALGISNEYHCYDWKHTGARSFILTGRNVYDLMAMMRHSSLAQTTKYLRSLGITAVLRLDPTAWDYHRIG